MRNTEQKGCPLKDALVFKSTASSNSFHANGSKVRNSELWHFGHKCAKDEIYFILKMPVEAPSIFQKKHFNLIHKHTGTCSIIHYVHSKQRQEDLGF